MLQGEEALSEEAIDAIAVAEPVGGEGGEGLAANRERRHQGADRRRYDETINDDLFNAYMSHANGRPARGAHHEGKRKRYVDRGSSDDGDYAEGGRGGDTRASASGT